MSAIAPTSSTYAAARRTFLAAAEAARVDVTHHPHPLPGREGEDLAVDVVELGDPAARDVVVVVSGTHGVEGYAGSALQTGLLQHQPALPGGVALVLVHALNPFGMSWVRRVNEDNVDLNRNFVDWSRPAPHNVEYDDVADLLVPDSWTAEEQERTFQALFARASEVGLDEFQRIVSGGQYHHPTGIFYGGTGPVWSHRWLRQWSADRLAQAERVAMIDLHTGLGPWGHGELIVSDPTTSPACQRAAAWWGDVRSMVDGASVSALVAGDWQATAGELAPQAEMTTVTIEYGTRDPITVLQALRADAWLHAHGDPRGAESAAIRDAVRHAFDDPSQEWIDLLWDRCVPVVESALTHLAG